MKKKSPQISLGIAFIACLSLSAAPALAQTAEDKSFLSMYFSDAELTVQSATRSPEPVSHVAENITVVTAAEIERMNAHTLADVLNTVTGAEVWSGLNPGQKASVYILGALDTHVTIIIDGVVRNYLWSQMPDIGMIPVQDIEKIEIIKGPASSAWGSALGGVVNIITKSGKSVDQGGVLSGSYGAGNFGDFRAETRGKLGGFGYYLSAGRLQAKNLAPYTSTAENNVYTKLAYDLTRKTDIQVVFALEKTKRDDDLDVAGDAIDSDVSRHLHTTLAVNSVLTGKLELNVSAWSYNQYQNNHVVAISTGDSSGNREANEGNGVRAKLIWKSDRQTIVVGADADNKTDTMVYITNGKRTIRQQALYANDTIALDKLTVIPGIRFDHVSANGEVTSPSIGLTYGLGNNTVLRAFAARGFNVPSPAATYGAQFWIPNPNLKVETVWSYQAGIESAPLKYLWMKLTLFRSDVSNKIEWIQLANGDMQVQNVKSERQEGVSIEAKTVPVFNASLTAGADFMRAKDNATGLALPQHPVQVYTVGVKYDDKQSLDALLQGRHINWNVMNMSVSKYNSMLVDFILNKKILQYKDTTLELFVNAHNLLDSAQYPTATLLNPERWYEAGLRYKF